MKVYRVEVIVADALPEKADVTLSEKGGLKLFPTDDGYELVVKGNNTDGVTESTINNFITINGKTSTTALTADNVDETNDVFTLTFNGLNSEDEEYQQKITVTVRTATPRSASTGIPQPSGRSWLTA